MIPIRLFILLALISMIIFLVVVIVPTHVAGIANIFWFGLAFAFFLADILFGGYVWNSGPRATNA